MMFRFASKTYSIIGRKIREYKPGWMAAELEEAVFETTQRHGAMVAHPADRVRGDVGSKPT